MAELYGDINVEFFDPVVTTIVDSKENLSQEDITNIKQTIKKEKDTINKEEYDTWKSERYNTKLLKSSDK